MCVCVCVLGGGAGGRGAPQWRRDLSWALILIRERLETVLEGKNIYRLGSKKGKLSGCVCLFDSGGSLFGSTFSFSILFDSHRSA